MRDTVGMVSFCSSNSKLSSYVSLILGLPTMKMLLTELGSKSGGRRIEILVEYGSVRNGTGDYVKVNESLVSDSRVSFDGAGSEVAAWKYSFNGKFVDPTADTFLVKIHMCGYPNSEAWSIIHEVGSHIANSYLKWVSGYDAEHNRFGQQTNPFYSQYRGGGAEPATQNSLAAKLLSEFNKCNLAK